MFVNQIYHKLHQDIHDLNNQVYLSIREKQYNQNYNIDLYFYNSEGKRFRSLGCAPCTIPIDSKAKNVLEVIEELKSTTSSERSGRAQDQENTYAMQKLRARGYM